MKEYKIGDRFTHDGVELEVVREAYSCTEFFFNKKCRYPMPQYCSETDRKDGKNVIFKKVEQGAPDAEKTNNQTL